jgi:hypothetical protein
MSNKVSTRINLISTTLLVVGLVSAAVAYSVKQSNSVKRKPAQGYTLVTKETAIPISGPESGMALGYRITTRYQKSDGAWKRVRVSYSADGKALKADTGFGIPGKGVYQLDPSRATLNFISSMPPKEETSYVPIRNGRGHSNFLKDEVVKGYETYVLRFPDQDGGYTDLYCASALDGRPIRRVTVSSTGVAIEEVVQIILGDPDDKVFENLPKWVVRYERFKERIQAMEDVGKPETASAMRQELERELAKQKASQ